MRQPIQLRTEFMSEPLGIDAKHPRFSWRLDAADRACVQTAYQIQVASSDNLLRADSADVWDSEIVKGDGSAYVRYAGPPLEPIKGYSWRVRVWTESDTPSPWSMPAHFETALMSSSDWQAVWIGGQRHQGTEEAHPAPYLRRRFQVSQERQVTRARLYVSGLGYYEAFINGQRVGDRVLDPAFTACDRRVLYSIYDVTDLLQGGANAVGVALGRGRYSMTTPNVWWWERPPWRDEPVLLLQLVVIYADGTQQVVATDSSWRLRPGVTIRDSFYEGEVRQGGGETPSPEERWAAPDYDDADWDFAEVVPGPSGRLQAQTIDPIRIVGTVRPKAIHKLGPAHLVADLGQMIAGWARLQLRGLSSGAEVTLRYGEKLKEDGSVDVEQNLVSGTLQTDRYIASGADIEAFEPRFSYKGFRYVEVIGCNGELGPEDLVAKVVHTDVEEAGEFSCDDELIGRIHHNTKWAILNNLHSIPTDTPVYEKNGWTGDAQLTAGAAMYNFNMHRFYQKWLADFADAQQPSGELPPIVPSSGWGLSTVPGGWGDVKGAVPGWDSAYILIPWWLYWHYGDVDVLAEHYTGMQRYLNYLGSRAEGYIVSEGLGDWLAPSGDISKTRALPPEGPAITSTAYYYYDSMVMAQVAKTLGKKADAQGFADLADSIKAAFNERFLDHENGYYRVSPADGYRQTSNVIPLAFGLVPPEAAEQVVSNLVTDIVERHDGHLSTGILGTRYLLPVLSEWGHVDVAYRVATQRTYPSWGLWIEQGATSLYEAWELSSRSRNHHMFGSIDQWFYEYLAGIRPQAPGFKKIKICPYTPSGLSGAQAKVDTVHGRVESAWQRLAPAKLVLDVTIPPNTTGRVHLPLISSGDGTKASPTTLGGQHSSSGACHLKEEEMPACFAGVQGDRAVFQVRSGSYRLISEAGGQVSVKGR